MHERQSDRDPVAPSLDDRTFPAVLGGVAACLALVIAASMTDTTSLDQMQHPAEPLSLATVTTEPPAPTP